MLSAESCGETEGEGGGTGHRSSYEQLDPQKSEVACSCEYCASTKEPPSESRFFLPMQIGALSYSAVMDSGSMRTYMDEKTLSSMQINKQNLIPSVARLADGSRATIRGKVPLDIRIGSIVRSLEACLMPCLAYDCILATDFLKDFEFVISFDTASWSLPSGESGNFVKYATAPASCAAIAEVSDEQTDC